MAFLPPAWGAVDNVYDPLDPVAGFDPRLANDYLQAGMPVFHDIDEPNEGRWRHSISEYFAGPTPQTALRRLLELEEAV
jgi:hypothetical protein